MIQRDFYKAEVVEEFYRSNLTLMDSSLWTPRAAEQWDRATTGWLDVMLSDDARPSGEIGFFEDQINVTEGIFNLAMHVQSDGLLFERDQDKEVAARDTAWREFFPEEARIGYTGHALSQAFRELVILPSRDVANHQLALGRIISEPPQEPADIVGGAETMK